jgi:mono/diheme cytochrome c family protein
MIGNLLALLLFLTLTILFIWLALRAWRAKSIPLRLAAGIPTVALALVGVALTGMMARGMLILYTRQAPPAFEEVRISGTPDQIARGEHLARTTCAGCHSATGDLPLAGGRNLSDDAGLPLGDYYPPNITPAGRVSTWTDGQLWAFFRYARLPDGRLTMMPVTNMSNLSDEDLTSVLAFIRSQDPVENEVPPLNLSPLTVLLAGSSMIDTRFEPKTGPVAAPLAGPTAAYGEYIVSYQDCRDCHGKLLDGNVSPPAPPGPNLRAVQGWTLEQFVTAMRTGVKPGEATMVATMPWRQIGRMDDVELEAIYQYLLTLE